MCRPGRPCAGILVVEPIRRGHSLMRSHRFSRCMQAAPAAAALVALVALAPDAGAQQMPGQSLALDRFNPAPAGDRMFGVQSPYVAGDLTPHVMLLVDY